MVRRVGVVGPCGAHTFELVGGDGGSRPGATDEDAALGPSIQNGPPQGGGEVGIVDRFDGIGAEVDNFVPGRTELFGDGLFQLVAGMVGRNGDLHGRESSGRSASLARAGEPTRRSDCAAEGSRPVPLHDAIERERLTVRVGLGVVHVDGQAGVLGKPELVEGVLHCRGFDSASFGGLEDVTDT